MVAWCHGEAVRRSQPLVKWRGDTVEARLGVSLSTGATVTLKIRYPQLNRCRLLSGEAGVGTCYEFVSHSAQFGANSFEQAQVFLDSSAQGQAIEH